MRGKRYCIYNIGYFACADEAPQTDRILPIQCILLAWYFSTQWTRRFCIIVSVFMMMTMASLETSFSIDCRNCTKIIGLPHSLAICVTIVKKNIFLFLHYIPNHHGAQSLISKSWFNEIREKKYLLSASVYFSSSSSLLLENVKLIKMFFLLICWINMSTV